MNQSLMSGENLFFFFFRIESHLFDCCLSVSHAYRIEMSRDIHRFICIIKYNPTLG